MKRLKQVDFNEALELTRKSERVYAFDLSADKITMKLFSRLEISEAVSKDRAYYVVEEVDE